MMSYSSPLPNTARPRSPVPSLPAGMGDHFVLMVDRLLTESTIGAAIESGNAAAQPVVMTKAGKKPEGPEEAESGEAATAEASPSPLVRRKEDGGGEDAGASCAGGKAVECRICQDEDEEDSMETPCSCSGSLKYAHRKCVQRWCDEKGDTICEICLQQFKPGYIAPPQLFHYGGSPMHFRGSWEISRQDLNNPHFLAMVTAGRGYSDTSYDDSGSSRNMVYCRVVAIIFMALLVLRHALPIILSGDDYSFTMFAVMILRVAGILVPVYVMVQALQVFNKRRRQQAAPASPVVSSSESDDETMHSTELRHHHRPSSPQLQPRSHTIRVH